MSFLQLLLLSRENGYPLAILYPATAMGNSKCSQPGLLPSPCLVRFCVRLLRLVDCEQSPAPFAMLLEFPMIVPPIDCLLLCLCAEVFLFFELGYVAPQVFQMTLDRKQQPGSLTSICAWCLQIPSQRHSAAGASLPPAGTPRSGACYPTGGQAARARLPQGSPKRLPEAAGRSTWENAGLAMPCWVWRWSVP